MKLDPHTGHGPVLATYKNKLKILNGHIVKNIGQKKSRNLLQL